ncbi:DUF29 domain-containing protein [Methylobacterium sp. BTF04]|uniref:DUF29 domain-containing protein n=1 Tax=Methylobacterium sp. BTF04 TaxID=2708300 RepID=UPI0013D01E79|nr:DUF29 domain-containing protein [Methylobacterium sp. BTF04]NEU12351.1 DUF29 domain-containing protein [Methylobacterium sp. BTF04]
MAHLVPKGDLPSNATTSANRTRYEDDLYGWVEEQVALLRDGAIESLDLTNIAEELSDVGAEQYNKLESALEILLMHMLKWDHQPERRSQSWELTIVEHRKRIEKTLRKNPALRARIGEAVADGFDLGRIKAAREMRCDLASLPENYPYDWTAITGRSFKLSDISTESGSSQ